MPYADRNSPLSSVPTVIKEPESLVRSSLVDGNRISCSLLSNVWLSDGSALRDEGWMIFSEEPNIGEVKLSQTR